MIFTLTFVAIIIVLLGATYLYYVYAPIPEVPILTSAIKTTTVKISKHNRTYKVYKPKRLAKNPGLIVALHGTGMTSERMRQWTGFELDRLADERGFIIVYPDGYKGNWNDCRKDSPFPAKKENIDDVGFMEEIIAHFIQANGVDHRKVCAYGFSNGGQLALRMAIERPELIRAVCAVSANLPTPATCSCTVQGPTSRVMLITGTADKINPYLGGEVSIFGMKRVGNAISALETAKDFAKRNDLRMKPVLTVEGKSVNATFEKLTYDSAGKAWVELVSIKGGGHVIPQPLFRFPRIMGKSVPDYNSAMEAVMFFGL